MTVASRYSPNRSMTLVDEKPDKTGICREKPGRAQGELKEGSSLAGCLALRRRLGRLRACVRV
jgi:hypothetical protein